MDTNDRPLIDNYDRALGAIEGTRGALSTQTSIIETIERITGLTESFIVRTFRQQLPIDGKENATRAEYTVFLRHIGTDARATKLVLPPRVVEALVRQRDSLADRARTRSAKRVAAERKSRGDKPGFQMTAAERKAAKARRKGGAK